jgi:hypothetical protein
MRDLRPGLRLLPTEGGADHDRSIPGSVRTRVLE